MPARAQTLDEIAAHTATGPAILCGTALAIAPADGRPTPASTPAMLPRCSPAGRSASCSRRCCSPSTTSSTSSATSNPPQHQTLTLLNGQPLAITICEDAWNDKGFWPRRLYPVDPVDELMRQWRPLPDPIAVHPRIILNISASPFWGGKRLRRKMLAAIARRHHAFVVMVNQVGGNDSLVFDGSSIVLAPNGEVVAQAASFSEDLIFFDTEALQAIPKNLAEPESSGESASGAESQFEATSATWDALVLGTRDYVRKCGFTKALVGLSGGIDSALVAAIAVEALGAENVLGVGMPSEFSSTGSIDDARALAANLGIRFELVPIHDVFTAYQSTLEPLFAGTPFGLAEENLQSRIRGALLMALSNKFGALVLTTGNKSEMSTGYCTLYGDMVGALAVIGDVFKTRVYALSRYANRDREIIPRTPSPSRPPPSSAPASATPTRSLPTTSSTQFWKPTSSATAPPTRSSPR